MVLPFTMLPEYLAINFVGSKVYICRTKHISLGNVAQLLSDKSFTKPASWWVKVKNFDEISKEIFVEILEYRTQHTPFSEAQLLYSAILETISFLKVRSLDTAHVMWQLKGAAENQVRKSSIESRFTFKEELPIYNEKSTEQTIEDENSIDTSVVVHEQTFTVPFKSLFFSFGCVKLLHKLKPLQQVQEIRIVNSDVRAEFDAVKNYFGKALNIKTATIHVKLSLKKGEIQWIEAHSKEIEKINAELIESVRFELVNSSIRKKVAIDIDKHLFTSDEFFDRLGLDKLGFNAFFEDDSALMNDILKVTDTKHYNNLRYLSSHQAHHILKLRFVLKPFSFIFLLEGEKNYHIIWETLDTAEATWHWPVEKNTQVLKLTLQKIEEIIQLVKVQGKTAYISSVGEPFRRIVHDYSNISEGFHKWKSELESYLN